MCFHAQSAVQICNLSAEISLFKQFIEVYDEKHGDGPDQRPNLREGSTPQQRRLAFLPQHGGHADLREGQEKHHEDPGRHLETMNIYKHPNPTSPCS